MNNKLKGISLSTRVENGSAVSSTREFRTQNLRTLIQALCGCRKNCAECKEEEALSE